MSVDSSLLKKRVSQSASGLTKNIHSFHGSTHVEEEIVDLNPNLRLVLAGRGRTMCEPLIVQAVMEMVHPHPNNEQFENITKLVELVYLGTASYDAEQAFINQTHAYSALPNCTVTRLNVSDRASTVPTEAEIRQTLGKADIILSSGGNTLYAVTRWKKLGIDKILHELVLSKHPPIFCGGSAGAIVWFEHGHSDSMDPTTLLHVDPDLTEEEKKDWKYIRVDGLGFIPALCIPHHNITPSNGRPRAVDSDEMLLRYPDQAAIGIDELAAVVVSDNQAWVVSADSDAACCVKRVVDDDEESVRIVTQKFLAADGPITLGNLLLLGKMEGMRKRRKLKR